MATLILLKPLLVLFIFYLKNFDIFVLAFSTIKCERVNMSILFCWYFSSCIQLSPAEQAQAVKLKGNKYFKGQKYDQAIKCYTEAISLCPEENKTDLAMYYQNRAAAYEQQVNIFAD